MSPGFGAWERLSDGRVFGRGGELKKVQNGSGTQLNGINFPFTEWGIVAILEGLYSGVPQQRHGGLASRDSNMLFYIWLQRTKVEIIHLY